VFSTLFSECLLHARTRAYGDVVRSHALETLSIVIRCVLAKNLAGWEVMEVFAGGVDESDMVFMVSCNLQLGKDIHDPGHVGVHRYNRQYSGGYSFAP
jgi:hypothetical protein